MKKKNNLYQQLLDKSKKVFPEVCIYRLRNTCLLISLILLKEKVNLNKLKPYVGGLLGNKQAKVSSHYQRLVRYFDNAYNVKTLWKQLLGLAIVQLVDSLDKRRGGKYLIIDGTSWSLGSRHFHFLTLSILFYGVSIPICWVELGKKGLSNLYERKALIKMASLYCNLKGMSLLADREYVGREWFDWLDERDITFYIRIPIKKYQKEVVGKLAYSHLCKKAKKGRNVETALCIEGKPYRLLATADTKDKHGLLLVMTNNKTGSTRKLLAKYRLRWKIETMFFHLKSNGFNLEDIGVTDPGKVRLMMSLVVLAYILCVCQGVKELKKIPRQPEEHGAFLYESIFRRGYGTIASYCFNIVLLLDLVIKLMQKPDKVPKTVIISDV